jgi:predicted S18 family serine protease
MKNKSIAILSLTMVLIFLLGILIGTYFRFEKTQEIFPEKEINQNFKIESTKMSFQAPALDDNGRGVITTLETNMREGSGLVLVNINNVFAGYSTQNSARIAVKAAGKYLNKNLSEMDVIYNIKTNAGFIDGASAGAAMTISVISLIENKPLQEKIGITGYINEDGIIGPASGIEQKAKALKENNFEKLIVSDQILLPKEFTRKTSCKNINSKEYCEINYIQEDEIIISGLEIIPIKTLKEVMNIFYGK